MMLQELQLNNFRNIENTKISFSPNINIIYGDNAQGKSNLLESIACLGLGKSMRVSSDKHLIKKGSDSFYIKGITNSENETNSLEIGFNLNTKKVKVNGVEKKRLIDFIGNMKIVYFTPDDMALVKEGFSEKRRFIDIMLCQVSNKYCIYLSKYQRILELRNKILKDKPQHARELIHTYDIQLSECAAEIWVMRKKAIDKLKEDTPLFFKDISSQEDDIEIIYQPCIKNNPIEWTKEELIELYLSGLRQVLDNDFYKGYSTLGPHRDEISILINGLDCKYYASQGQQRMITLSLKIAEMKFIEFYTSEIPILLLDDVLSELHISKVNKLLQTLNDSHRQVFISTVVPVELENLNYKVYGMNQGNIIEY